MSSRDRIPKLPTLPHAVVSAPAPTHSAKRSSTSPSHTQPPPSTRPIAAAHTPPNPQVAAAVTADRYRRLSSALDACLPSFTQLYLHRKEAGMESKDWLMVWAKLHEAAWLGMGLEDLGRMGETEFNGTMERLGVEKEWWVGLRDCIAGYVLKMGGGRAEGGEED